MKTMLVLAVALVSSAPARADFAADIAPYVDRKGKVRIIQNGSLRYPTTGCQVQLSGSFQEVEFSFREPLPILDSFSFADESAMERQVEEGRVIYRRPTQRRASSLLCGDFVSTRSIRRQLTLAENEIELRYDYRCGLDPRRKTFVLSCLLD